MFLPTTKKEIGQWGWDGLDVILITGDAYIDSPFFGIAVIGRVLVAAGFRVGIIAQPDVKTENDISRLGEPALFWGVSGGSIDSMVANRTASGRKRKSDDYTPGGINNRRPDRAVLVYANCIRRSFKQTRPIVLGGLEASLRRIAHYDYWADAVRKSILFDAKADYLLYGMADRAVVELARTLQEGGDPAAIRGLCYAGNQLPEGCLELPSFQEAATDKAAFVRMFTTFYENNDPLTAKPLAQQQDNRYLIQNPPQPYLTTAELDAVHDLDYMRDLHPFDGQHGSVKALETIRFSITTHRGCYGECNFCAIAVHQGRTVRSRSQASIIREAESMARQPFFKGTIHDVGGPTANMYGSECTKKIKKGSCVDKRCLFPDKCKVLTIDHGKQIALLQALRSLEGVKKVVVASGIRYDLILADRKNGANYLRQVVRHHVSGQMKIAPEHSEDRVLAYMGKPGKEQLLVFRDLFNRLTKQEGKKQFLTYYIIAAHPGCTMADMLALRQFARQELKVLPRQVQIFTPTPSTWSTLMYWTGINPWNGQPCFVERSFQGREKQKSVIVPHQTGKKISRSAEALPGRKAVKKPRKR